MKYVRAHVAEISTLTMPRIIEAVRDKIKFRSKNLKIIDIFVVPYYDDCKMLCFNNISLSFLTNKVQAHCLHHGKEEIHVGFFRFTRKRNIFPQCRNCYFTLRKADCFSIQITIDKLLDDSREIMNQAIIDTNRELLININKCLLTIKKPNQ